MTKSSDLHSSNYGNLITWEKFHVDIYSICVIHIISETIQINQYAPKIRRIQLTWPYFNEPTFSSRNSCVFGTDLSDFHKMAETVMKSSFQKLQPEIINYRDYIPFQNNTFREALLSGLLNINLKGNEARFSNFLDMMRTL